MNINQPLLHPAHPWPRRAMNAVKDFEPHKVAHLGIAILIGSLSVATTIQSKIVANGNYSWETTCTAEVCSNLQLNIIINAVSSAVLLLFVCLHFKMAIPMMTPAKKIAKIALPAILGAGIAATISSQLPERCTNITGYSPPKLNAWPCLTTFFNAENGSTFFPHCIVSPEFLHEYYRRGGFCINTTIDQTNFNSWEQWVYTSPWPGIERTNYKPGYCGMLELETPSVITNWSGIPSLDLEALEYWKGLNSNYSLPVSIQSTKTVIANNSDGGWDSIGNWMGTIQSTGWIMKYVNYPEVCFKPYAELPQFVLDCSSDAFRLNYTTLFDPGIIQHHAIVASFDRDVELCKPWIRFILFANPALLGFGLISSIVLCCQKRLHVPPHIQHAPPPQLHFPVHLNDPLVEEDPPLPPQPIAEGYTCV
jgi:hypothetical protein